MMPIRIEIIAGTITIFSTIITGDFISDLICGIVVYTASRLFYNYFGKDITNLIDKMKKKQ